MLSNRLIGCLNLGLPAVVVTVLAIVATPAASQNRGPVGIENPGTASPVARDSEGHWTPETLFEAEPLDLPIPDATYQALTEQAESQAQQAAGPDVIENGAYATEETQIAPDLGDMLFEDALPVPEVEEFVPEAAGTAGAYFSSSRLVPEDARLHYPYRINGKLFFQQNGQNFICSGTVLRPRLILTAGHCVHRGSGGANGFFGNFLFVPAYLRGNAPYQAWSWRWVGTTGSWANSNGQVPNAADFAIIEVEDRRFGSETKRIGDVVGWAGYRTNALNPNHTKKVGYPGNHDRGEVMHQVDSGQHANSGAQTVLYGSDMRGGSSGGGWFENFGVKAEGQQGGINTSPNFLVGVTSYGFVSPDPLVQGSSTLNAEFQTLLNLACNHRAGNC